METSNIVLFVFDTKVNFEKSKKNLGSEGSTFKKIICIEDEIEFEKEFQLLQDVELFFMVVHVFYTDSINGIKRFVASRICKKYPALKYMFISEGDSKEINKQMIDAEFENKPVYKYHQVQSNLEDGKFKVYSKKEIIQLTTSNPLPKIDKILKDEYPQCDYAIITALEEDEMTPILPMITKTGKISNDKHLIEYGFITSKPEKKVAYASQQTTGMIDAAILATELINLFHPKYLIMTGVLGGKPNDVNIGDIIVATRTFTIDKGKLTELGFKKEIETSSNENSDITLLKREKTNIMNYLRN
jgi:hypothetical protein